MCWVCSQARLVQPCAALSPFQIRYQPPAQSPVPLQDLSHPKPSLPSLAQQLCPSTEHFVRSLALSPRSPALLLRLPHPGNTAAQHLQGFEGFRMKGRSRVCCMSCLCPPGAPERQTQTLHKGAATTALSLSPSTGHPGTSSPHSSLLAGSQKSLRGNRCTG